MSAAVTIRAQNIEANHHAAGSVLAGQRIQPARQESIAETLISFCPADRGSAAVEMTPQQVFVLWPEHSRCSKVKVKMIIVVSLNAFLSPDFVMLELILSPGRSFVCEQLFKPLSSLIVILIDPC